MAAPERITRDTSTGQLRKDAAGNGKKHRVLYAEDQTTTRVVTTALLERMGYDVVAVEDGELAVEEARNNAFDVILLDIEMPVMDGVTAARSIRRDIPQAKATPILALSAFLADSTEHSVWRDAFDSAVPKPANSNELGRALRAALLGKPTEALAVALPRASSLWASFSSELPAGMRSLLARAAAQEMNHLVLTYASCTDAGDHHGQSTCRTRLNQLAQNFGASAVSDALSAGTVTSQSLLLAIGQWQTAQAG